MIFCPLVDKSKFHTEKKKIFQDHTIANEHLQLCHRLLSSFATQDMLGKQPPPLPFKTESVQNK